MNNDKYFINGLIEANAPVITAFIDAFGGYIYAVVYNVLGNKMDSEEATQDVVMKVIKNAHKFDFSCSIKTWMYTIAKRTAIDYTRKVKYTSDIDHAYSIQSSEDMVSDILVEERNDKIRALLDKIPADEKELVELFYLNELSNAEISELTGLSVSNIKVKLFRARKKLGELIEKETYYEV